MPDNNTFDTLVKRYKEMCRTKFGGASWSSVDDTAASMQSVEHFKRMISRAERKAQEQGQTPTKPRATVSSRSRRSGTTPAGVRRFKRAAGKVTDGVIAAAEGALDATSLAAQQAADLAVLLGQAATKQLGTEVKEQVASVTSGLHIPRKRRRNMTNTISVIVIVASVLILVGFVGYRAMQQPEPYTGPVGQPTSAAQEVEATAVPTATALPGIAGLSPQPPPAVTPVPVEFIKVEVPLDGVMHPVKFTQNGGTRQVIFSLQGSLVNGSVKGKIDYGQGVKDVSYAKGADFLVGAEKMGTVSWTDDGKTLILSIFPNQQ